MPIQPRLPRVLCHCAAGFTVVWVLVAGTPAHPGGVPEYALAGLLAGLIVATARPRAHASGDGAWLAAAGAVALLVGTGLLSASAVPAGADAPYAKMPASLPAFAGAAWGAIIGAAFGIARNRTRYRRGSLVWLLPFVIYAAAVIATRTGNVHLPLLLTGAAVLMLWLRLVQGDRDTVLYGCAGALGLATGFLLAHLAESQAGPGAGAAIAETLRILPGTMLGLALGVAIHAAEEDQPPRPQLLPLPGPTTRLMNETTAFAAILLAGHSLVHACAQHEPGTFTWAYPVFLFAAVTLHTAALSRYEWMRAMPSAAPGPPVLLLYCTLAAALAVILTAQRGWPWTALIAAAILSLSAWSDSAAPQAPGRKQPKGPSTTSQY